MLLLSEKATFRGIGYETNYWNGIFSGTRINLLILQKYREIMHPQQHCLTSFESQNSKQGYDVVLQGKKKKRKRNLDFILNMLCFHR